MRLALMIEGQEGVSWDDWTALAEACERHGVETLFRSDHYISQSAESVNVAHDAWTTIAGLAARTSTLRFGTLVSPVTFRAPALLANAAATADHISGGRIELGLGAGWLVHRLWTDARVDFHGEHYTLEDAPAQPKPLQQPHPPLIVGGSGKRGTLEPALRFADEYNLPFVAPAELARVKQRVGDRLAVSTMTGCIIGETRDDALDRAHMLYARVQRDVDFDTWRERYAARAIIGSVDEAAARLREYEQAGAERVMLQHLLHTDLEPVRLIGERLRTA